jgi:hypothetical protein
MYVFLKWKESMMKLIDYILTGLLTVLLTGNLFAQDNQTPGEVFIEQAPFEHNEAVEQFTDRFVSMFQMDFDSFDTFDQTSNVAIINQFGNQNRSYIVQTGIGNMSRMNILGDYNIMNQLQDGTGNQFILNLEGSNNVLDYTQIGSENRMRKDLAGNNHQQTFIQNGHGLSLQLIDGGDGGVPLHVEQNGNGTSILIENY